MPKTEETWMDGKKIREAIEAFQGQVNWLKRIDDKDCEEACRCCIEYFETAIKALEKQFPKKPEKDGVTDSRGVFHPINGIDGVPYDLCPNCYSNLCTTGMFGRNKERMKYCEKCGQRLDWSE